MGWFVRDLLIVVVGTVFGLCVGAFWIGVDQIAMLFLGRFLPKSTQMQLIESQPNVPHEYTGPVGCTDVARVIAVWGIAAGVRTAYVVWRVHWLARQQAIVSAESSPYFWLVVGPVWAFAAVVIAREGFIRARSDFSFPVAVGWTIVLLVVHACAFFVVAMILGVVAHFAAGGKK